MAAAQVFRIENGVFALDLVDTEAVGYLDTWQAPMGKTLTTVAIADYAGGVTFSCQAQAGSLTASPNTSDSVTAPTFCDPEVTTTQVGVTSYTLDATILQDPHVSTGISKYLFENDTLEAYFYLGLNGTDPPTAIGRCRIVAGAFGGDARTDLTATLSLPVSRKPDIEFGDATTSIVVPGTTGVTTMAATSSSTPAPAPASEAA